MIGGTRGKAAAATRRNQTTDSTQQPMTTHERMRRMLDHQAADRVPITDHPWAATLERWHREGLPADIDWAEYFDLDRFGGFGIDNSPRYPTGTLEETDEYIVHTNAWGATMRNWKHHGGVPEFLGFVIDGPDAWRRAKERIAPTHDRVDLERLRREFPKWRAEGRWIGAHLWFGFDVTHSWMVGTEAVLLALAEDPGWIVDMWRTQLDTQLALLDWVWEQGFHFDGIGWPDDMGYKGHQFFSLAMYRELLRPVHRRACEWAQAHGIAVSLHSCGDVRPFIPDLIEVGVQILNPIEVKAGMDPVWLKGEYGDRLLLHGGLNAALFADPEKLWAQMRAVIPVMKRNGGYMLSSDHSVPDSVSLDQFREFVALAKELGAY